MHPSPSSEPAPVGTLDAERTGPDPTAPVGLELRAVSRTFGEGPTAVTALHHVDLQVGEGEMVAVVGPSGSGKSTLLTIAGGLDTPTSGEVVVGGQRLDDLGPAGRAQLRRRRLGFVFQELNLLSGLTASENVAAPLELDGVRTSAARTQAIALLEQLGLGARAHAFPEDLSGGERQRVAIARALVGDRRLVLADEPTGALDTATGAEVVALLRSAARHQASVLVVTHDPAVAAAADRTVSMRDGRLVQP